MTGPPDTELVAAARQGDAAAFGALYRRHARAVYNLLFRRTADWGRAEDLTSAVFLEAWRRREAIRLHEGSALPWLLGVATNLRRNHWRSMLRGRRALARLGEGGREPDFADDAAGRLDDERRMRELLALVGRLPRHERHVLALCDWSGLSYAEAAIALEVPVGTVRSRLSRARRRLRALAGEPGPSRTPTPLPQEAVDDR
jgi:RNA polymerase sigma factor (sigma-70 family)